MSLVITRVDIMRLICHWSVETSECILVRQTRDGPQKHNRRRQSNVEACLTIVFLDFESSSTTASGTESWWRRRVFPHEPDSLRSCMCESITFSPVTLAHLFHSLIYRDTKQLYILDSDERKKRKSLFKNKNCEIRIFSSTLKSYEVNLIRKSYSRRKKEKAAKPLKLQIIFGWKWN